MIVTTVLLLLATLITPSKPTVVVIVGAPGAEEYAPQFREWAKRWGSAAKKGGADFTLIGDDKTDDEADRGRLQKLLTDAATEEKAPLWLVLIGHGTYDGHAAKFNLR